MSVSLAIVGEKTSNLKMCTFKPYEDVYIQTLNSKVGFFEEGLFVVVSFVFDGLIQNLASLFGIVRIVKNIYIIKERFTFANCLNF